MTTMGINALHGRTMQRVEAGGVRLVDEPGLSSDVWRCPRLTQLIEQHGSGIIVSAGLFCLQVRGNDGRFVANIPGTELQSSLGELFANRPSLIGRAGKQSIARALNRK